MIKLVVQQFLWHTIDTQHHFMEQELTQIQCKAEREVEKIVHYKAQVRSETAKMLFTIYLILHNKYNQLKDQLTKIQQQINIVNFIILTCAMLGFLSNNTKKQHHSSTLVPSTSSQSANGHKKIKDYSYNSIDRIGKGFSSIVYKGQCDATNQIVAVKAIDMKGIKDSISRQMLQCQIEALRTIKHQNVLKCYDVVKQTSHCYIITQYCNGGDLSGYLKKKRRITQQQTLRLLRDIVSGFIEIGQKGFLHRDLKLANIFINDDKAKIADFGFAKKIRMSSQKQKYNVGSPLYMSPQALKRNIYSLKNDIWSIGIMTYEMLHGETPWQCKTERELIDKMMKIPVRFRESIKISESTKDFIRKCLQVDEKDRMSLEDLKQWISTKQSRSTEYSQNNVLGPSRSENLPPRLNLNHKPMSNLQKMAYQNQNQTAKLQLTHRLSTRSQKQISSYSNKQNTVTRPSGLGPIPKSLIQRNNSIVVNEINTFRLVFKLMQKLKKNKPQQTLLINLLSNQVIKRVTTLKNCFDSNQNQYGLSMIENYMNERQNEGIKKYKSVVMEYFKKYTTEIKSEQVSGFHPLNTQIIKFLRNQTSLREQEQLLICYWMIQYLGINRETPKQKLDAIIDPKIKLNKGYIQQRIKELN